MLTGAPTDCAAPRLASQAASFQAKSSIRLTTDAFCGPQLGSGADRVRLQGQQGAVGGAQLELVDRPLAEPRDEDLPDADPAAPPHRVAPAVPAVEVADHRDASGIRRPDREMDARHAGMLDRVRAETLPQTPMRALADEIVVHLAQDRWEAVGVVHLPRATLVVGAQGVAEPDRPILEHALEQAGLVAGFQLADDGAGAFLDHLEPGSTGHQRADHNSARDLVRAEHGERIVMPGLDQRPDGRVREATLRGACHSCPPSPINRGTSEKRAPDQSILPVQSAAAELHLNSLCIIGRDFNSLCITMRRV